MSTKTFAPKEIDFKGFTQDNSSTVTVKQKGQEINLKKDGGQWRVNEFSISASALKDLFEGLKNLEPLSLASRNLEKEEDFEIKPDMGTILSLKKGETVQDFVLGKTGNVWGTFYLKKQDSKNIYLVKGSLKEVLGHDLSWWRDKTVVKIDPAVISSIVIKDPKRLITFTKDKDSKWSALSGAQKVVLEQARLDRILNALNPLEAFDFAEPDEDKALKSGKNVTNLIFSASDGSIAVELSFLKKDDAWLVKANSQDTVYKISNGKIEDILVSYDELFKKK